MTAAIQKQKLADYNLFLTILAEILQKLCATLDTTNLKC